MSELVQPRQLTSRQFNQDTGLAKRAAAEGPVVITDRGRPSYVLMTYDEFCALARKQATLGLLLSMPGGIESVDFDPQPDRSIAEPANLA